MRIHILSDLHLEFGSINLPDIQADVTVLAGDTDTGFRGVEWVLKTIPDRPVVYVLGNHEYYRQTIPKFIDKFHARIKGTNIHLLEQEMVEFDDTVFLGCTLWTDMQLDDNPAIAEVVAGERMTDYSVIRTQPKYRKLKPADTIRWHRRNIKWIERSLSDFNGIHDCGAQKKRLVIVTHHAPSRQSIPEAYGDDECNPAYASNMDEMVRESGAKLWIHGHIHSAADYRIGTTRVVCNPRGYVPDQAVSEFRPGLVLEV